jgi:hypothetical protein
MHNGVAILVNYMQLIYHILTQWLDYLPHVLHLCVVIAHSVCAGRDSKLRKEYYRLLSRT